MSIQFLISNLTINPNLIETRYLRLENSIHVHESLISLALPSLQNIKLPSGKQQAFEIYEHKNQRSGLEFDDS